MKRIFEYTENLDAIDKGICQERCFTLDKDLNILHSGEYLTKVLSKNLDDILGESIGKFIESEDEEDMDKVPHFGEVTVEINDELFRLLHLPDNNNDTLNFLILDSDSSLFLQLRHLAHELRNPLTNISLSTEFIKHSDSGEDLAEFTEIIERNITKLTDVLDAFSNKYRK